MRFPATMMLDFFGFFLRQTHKSRTIVYRFFRFLWLVGFPQAGIQYRCERESVLLWHTRAQNTTSVRWFELQQQQQQCNTTTATTNTTALPCTHTLTHGGSSGRNSISHIRAYTRVRMRHGARAHTHRRSAIVARNRAHTFCLYPIASDINGGLLCSFRHVLAFSAIPIHSFAQARTHIYARAGSVWDKCVRSLFRSDRMRKHARERDGWLWTVDIASIVGHRRTIVGFAMLPMEKVELVLPIPSRIWAHCAWILCARAVMLRMPSSLCTALPVSVLPSIRPFRACSFAVRDTQRTHERVHAYIHTSSRAHTHRDMRAFH